MYACLDLEGRLPIPAPPTCSTDLVYTEVVKEGEEEVRGILCCFSTHLISHEGKGEGGGTKYPVSKSYICTYSYVLLLHASCKTDTAHQV